MKSLKSIFSKPLAKIKFPLEEEKHYPLYSQCLSKRRKAQDFRKQTKQDSHSKQSAKQHQKNKTSTNKSLDTTNELKNNLKTPNNQEFIEKKCPDNEFYSSKRNVSKQHKWPAKSLKRPSTNNSYDINNANENAKLSKNSKYDLLGTLLSNNSDVKHMENDTPVSISTKIRKEGSLTSFDFGRKNPSKIDNSTLSGNELLSKKTDTKVPIADSFAHNQTVYKKGIQSSEALNSSSEKIPDILQNKLENDVKTKKDLSNLSFRSKMGKNSTDHSVLSSDVKRNFVDKEASKPKTEKLNLNEVSKISNVPSKSEKNTLDHGKLSSINDKKNGDIHENDTRITRKTKTEKSKSYIPTKMEMEMLAMGDSAVELSEKLSKVKAASALNVTVNSTKDNKEDKKRNGVEKERKKPNQTLDSTILHQNDNSQKPIVANRMTTRNMAKRQPGRKPGLTLKQQEAEKRKKTEGRRLQNQQRELERKRLKSIPCSYFVKLGYCKNGDECKNSHDVQVEKKKDCCKFYIGGTCLRGDACLYYHGEWPCKFFHQGYCQAGNQCKFSHKPLTDEMRSMLEARTEEENLLQSQAAEETKIEHEPTTAVEKATEPVSETDDATTKNEDETTKSSETNATPINPLDLLPSLYADLT